MNCYNASVASLLVLAAGGCGSELGSGPGEAQLLSAVGHRYFPLTPGTVRVYEGEQDGLARRDVVRTLAETRHIIGIACTAVRQEVFLDDELAEVTTEWYAEDPAGNVWKFGEETLEPDSRLLEPTGDSWLAGIDGAEPSIAFPTDLRVGDRYSVYRPGSPDLFEVRSLTETASIAGGTFTGCLELLENEHDPNDTDIILYAPGVGPVAERSPAGKIEMTSISSPGRR